MASVAIKIVGLTLIYFVGWYICEKLFKAIKDKFGNQVKQAKQNVPSRKKVVPLASITPIDQTWRYIKSLKSPDWRVRKIACVQLGERRGTAVVQALIEALDDSKEDVSLAASEALTKIGDPAAIEALALYCKELEYSTNKYFESHRAA